MAPDHRLVAPAARFSEERDSDPPVGYPLAKPAARLASPWPTSSRFGSQRCRSSAANRRAMATGSAKPTTAMTAPGTSSWGSADHTRSRLTGGRPVGMSPTSSPG